TKNRRGDQPDDDQLGPVKSHGSPPTDWFLFSQSRPRGRAGHGAATFRGTTPAPPAGLLAVARCRHPPAIAKRLNNAMTIATFVHFMAHTLSTSSSASAYSSPPPFAWTVRKPSPRYGFAASQGTGIFFGTEWGAGSANISPFAAWCGMWPVIWWCSWWMCP